jgi:ribonuclease J
MAKGKSLKLIPLGGLGEIGKNMTVLEYNGEIIIIDCGLAFPDEDMLGIDLVIPDMTYLIENKNRIRAVFITHGHEDHIGSLSYLLREIKVPVYATKLTIGLIKGKLQEHRLTDEIKLLREVRAGTSVKEGAFKVDFIRVSHSIADVVAMAIHTPVGIVVHTADFKFDQTPIGGQVTDFHSFAELGDRGVLLLLSDSTNAERPGFTMSERAVGDTFDEVFRQAEQRIIVASFASNVHRIQQIIDAAQRYKRRVCVTGRSMVNVVNIASELGYLHIPDGMLVDIDQSDRIPHNELVIITTGSQGEPMSALVRMAMSDHRKLGIIPGDTVIISALPIPGNEKMVHRTINQLFRQGAFVIYEALSGVHVSGHASQEELKLMLNLTRPKYFMPVHGEYRHLLKHAKLAEAVGIPEERILLPSIGDVLEFDRSGARVVDHVPAGPVLVDGLGVGDVGNIVLRDRRLLAQDGILIVVVTMNRQTKQVLAGPDIVSRGFVYIREADELMEEAKRKVEDALKLCLENGSTDWTTIKTKIRETLTSFFDQKMKRRPIILPIIMEV